MSELIKYVNWIDGHIDYFKIKYGNIKKKLDIDLGNGLRYYIVVSITRSFVLLIIEDKEGNKYDTVLSVALKQMESDIELSNIFLNAIKKAMKE